MYKAIITILVLCAASSINCDCPNVTVQKVFDPSQYTGSWFEVQRFELINEVDLKCIQAVYTAVDSLNVKVNNSGINKKTGAYEQTLGTAAIPNPQELAKLAVTFNFGPISVTSDYWVVDSDYNNYSLVYSCRVTAGKTNEFAWILSRQRTLSQATVNTLRNKLQSFGVDVSKFLITDQSNC